KSESIRTEPRGCVVTKSGTARAIFSTSTAEQFDRSTNRTCLPRWSIRRIRSCMTASPNERQPLAVLNRPLFRLARGCEQQKSHRNVGRFDTVHAVGVIGTEGSE